MKALLFLHFFAVTLALAEQPYTSPYRVSFQFAEKELIGDIVAGTRGAVKNESSERFADWYSPNVKTRFGSWGPPAQHFPAPAGLSEKSEAWMQQRMIAVALRFRGYRYQHHHIPDWEPPANWPYKPSPLGAQSKGVDCSNLTAFVFNMAFGMKPSSDIKEQAAMTEVAGPGEHHTSRPERIEKPASYADFNRTLQTGDLLFIKKRGGDEISHVVIWVGAIGQSRGDVPLIIDSTGEGTKDETGVAIPDGVQLRPFSPSSWYFKSASHALRLIPPSR